MVELIGSISAKMWLLIIVCVVVVTAIGVPLFSQWLGNRDYKRQVEGKRKERYIPDNVKSSRQEKTNPNLDPLENEAWLKSKQNIFGPK